MKPRRFRAPAVSRALAMLDGLSELEPSSWTSAAPSPMPRPSSPMRLKACAAISRIWIWTQALRVAGEPARFHPRLARKHHVEPEALPDRFEALKTELQTLGIQTSRSRNLEAELKRLQTSYQKAADELHAKRVKTASDLGKKVTAVMQELGMGGGKFRHRGETPDPARSPPGHRSGGVHGERQQGPAGETAGQSGVRR